MSGPIEPHWELLPDQPEAFFDLSDGYDLRDLKRKYNSFIRQFKPERFPEEFQKIREAYECLNDALRYQEPPRSQTVKSDLQFDWDFNDAPEQDQPPGNPLIDPLQQPDVPLADNIHQSHTSEGLTAQSKPLSLHERINSDSLPKLYADLQEKELKTPYDFYALAVFSDILEDSAHSFPDWLLEGLKVHREEPALFEMLRQYFATEPFHEGTAKLLETTSQVVRSDRFYYLTERAWDEQLKNTSFDIFRQNLLSCESNLLDHEVAHMLVFYLHILKTAIWKADEDWINASFSLIEENYDRLPHWVDEELEFLYQLKEYREQRTQFLEGGPVRTKIDQTIFEYCTKNEQEADRVFLECQYKLVSLEEELLHEFKIPTDEFESIQILWEKMAEAVYDRNNPMTFEEEEDSIEQNALQLGRRLLTGRRRFRYKLMDDISTFGLGFVILGAIVFSIYFCTNILNPVLAVFVVIGFLSVSLLTLKMIVKFQIYYARKYYYTQWRFEIIKFYQTQWFPLLELADELDEIDSIKKGRTYYHGLDKIAELMITDMGLFFYVTAQRLLSSCQ